MSNHKYPRFEKTSYGIKLQKDLTERTKELKKEISRKASMANKRLARLEKNGLTETPSYKNWVEYGGGVKFSVKGKNYNELQAELARVNHFLDNATSTVRGANRVLKDMAKTTGMKYEKIGDLYEMGAKFFELSSKVEQYLNSAMQGASAIGYQKIWQAINQYIKEEQIALNDSEVDIDDLLEKISDLAASEYNKELIDNIFDTFEQLNN